MVPSPAAICKLPRELDGGASLFVSSSFLLFTVLQALFRKARIAQGAADSLKFTQQFFQAISIV
jgi:hypothetical protein